MQTPTLAAAFRALALASFLTAAGTLTTTTEAHAQSSTEAGQNAAAARDAAEMAAYRLSDDGLAKFTSASRALMKAAEGMEDPDDDAVEGREDIVTAMAEAYDAHPPLRDAIVGAGWTTREFSLFTVTLMQASLGAMLVEQEPAAIDHLPAGLAKENVRFVQSHQAQLNALQAEMQSARGDTR